MRKFSFLFGMLSVSLLFLQCNYTNQNCSLRKLNFANHEYEAQGCIVNNLEQGEWSFFNIENQLTEKGSYENGLRVGRWYYPQNKSDSIIEWKKYDKVNLKLTFNIPALLEVAEDSSNYIKFSNKDTSKLFNVVLSVNELAKSEKKIEEYYQQGEEEILANDWTFTSERNKITTKSRIIYFNDYSISQKNGNRFRVLNIYGMIDSKNIFEISCRFNKEIEGSARLVFFSLLTNCFYDMGRFINPFEEIKAFTVN
jgi:hypothetical protein